jgi:hypothetical protein
MAETKPFASLSSGLLARKGTAKPAMRPQGFGSFGSSLEDLGWNDMGHAPGALHDINEAHDLPEHVPSSIEALTPAPGGRAQAEPPAVVEQQRALEARLAPPQPQLVPEPEPEPEPEAELQAEPEAELQPEPQAEAGIEPEAETPAQPEAQPEARIVKLPSVRRKAKTRAPAVGVRAKAAFTLRLDPERHLKLRLACALSRRSAQMLVTEALDDFLDSLPELEALSGHVPGQANQR